MGEVLEILLLESNNFTRMVNAYTYSYYVFFFLLASVQPTARNRTSVLHQSVGIITHLVFHLHDKVWQNTKNTNGII